MDGADQDEMKDVVVKNKDQKGEDDEKEVRWIKMRWRKDSDGSGWMG